ncbi:MAG: ABC transporter substrate-binding protein [Fusobacteriaceae bacterium]|nr:ABC transporter substrate-binding protein [Fusobacteriaceae bacterium]
MKKTIRLVCLFLLAALTLPTLLYPKATSDLIIAQQADPKTLDPAASNDVYSNNININLYDRLFDRTPDMQLENNLAESYTQLDSVTLQVKIKKGVKFHNGDELTAEDVKFTLERASKAPGGMALLGDLDGVDIVDPYTVNIKTKKPYGPLFNALSHWSSSILSKKYLESAGDKAFFEPVGTGPFRFESWKTGDKLVLQANKNYHRGAPGVDTAIFRPIPESDNRVIALETGEIDISITLEPLNVPIIKSKDYLKLYHEPSVGLTYLGFNCEKGPTSDVKVRQAVCYALDLQSILDNAFNDLYLPATSVIAPATMGFNDKIPFPKRDVEKAKQLLAEAGYKDGLKLRLWTNGVQTRTDAAVIMQDQLREVGIEISIEILEWSAYLDKLGKAEHDMYILGNPGSTDPDGIMFLLYHSKNKGTAGNMAFYGNPEVDELLDRGRETVDQAERAKYYLKAQELIVADRPILSLGLPPILLGTQAYIEGFAAYPTFVHFFRNVKKNNK